MKMNKLLQEAFLLKQEINSRTARLREINLELARTAPFPASKRSTELIAGTIKARIQLRQNIRWDQEKLAKVKTCFNHFPDVFKTEYKPKSQKTLDIAMVNPDFARAVEWARTVTDGAPSVQYERIDDDT